jgi:hypothetical protein
MTTLYFERFEDAATPELRAAAATLEREYETRGACTHVAFPAGTGEVIFAFPLDAGWRFVGVAPPDELTALVAGRIESGVDECELESTDAELEAGVPTQLSLI